ncbi:MAG: AMP-binding protein, partial [Sphingobacterium sp.]
MEEKLRLFDLARHQISKYPDLNMFAHKLDGKWNYIKTADFLEKVDNLSKGLIELGVKPNEKVGLIAGSSMEWHMIDFAIQQIGAVVVAIYPNITDADYQYIFNDAEIRVCIVSNKSLYDRLMNLTESIYTLKYIFCISDQESTRSWNELNDLGVNCPEDKLIKLRDQIKPEDLATLIYTSGTTGKPKGVMLSHNNIFSNVLGAAEITPCKA